VSSGLHRLYRAPWFRFRVFGCFKENQDVARHFYIEPVGEVEILALSAPDESPEKMDRRRAKILHAVAVGASD